MSRIGIQPIKIEDGVEVNIDEKNVIVKGSLGEINIKLPKVIEAKKTEVDGVNYIVVDRKDETKQSKSLHGTFRSLINNAVFGVKNGYEKKLEIVGVGYRGRIEGNHISLSIGYTVPVIVEMLEGVKVDMPDELTIVIKGVDKQLVNQFAANIRKLKKPEPYKGKGIKYSDEVVRRKSSKTAAA